MKTQTASSYFGDSETRIAQLENAIKSRRSLNELFDKYGDTDIHKSILAGLSGVTESHNVWQAVHAALRNAIRAEHDAALVPDLTDEALRCNVGRLASLEDFRNALFQLWSKANPPVKST